MLETAYYIHISNRRSCSRPQTFQNASATEPLWLLPIVFVQEGNQADADLAIPRLMVAILPLLSDRLGCAPRHDTIKTQVTWVLLCAALRAALGVIKSSHASELAFAENEARGSISLTAWIFYKPLTYLQRFFSPRRSSTEDSVPSPSRLKDRTETARAWLSIDA